MAAQSEARDVGSQAVRRDPERRSAAPVGARRDLILVGASNGGLAALTALLRPLPSTLPAAVVAVLHQVDHGRNMLVDVLDRVGALPAKEAAHGEPIEPGRVYVPPIDRHLLVSDGHFELSHGPKENFVRPAIDPLFRSAARSFGARAIGVILSGTLDDGTGGLLAVKRRGGTALVQDPATALHPGMPRSALEFVDADHIAAPDALGARLVELAGTPVAARAARPGVDLEVQVQEAETGDMSLVDALGDPSSFSCPDCGGVLWEIHDGNLVRYRCHTGHAFGMDSLAAGKSEDVEVALWTAIRALKEKVELGRRLADRARDRGVESEMRRSEERVQFMERQVESLRELIEKL
jgi:two-component system chemotaxis response regulator CheB